MKRVTSIADAAKESKEDTIILVDEADKLFVDDGLDPPKKCKVCIGFTATIPSGDEGYFVQSRLQNLGFHIWKELGYKEEVREIEATATGF